MGHLDLEALELALRSSMHQIGGVLLEKLLNSDEGGYAGTRTKCGQAMWPSLWNTAAKKSLRCFPGLRYNGPIITARFVPVALSPRIKELDIVGTCFSPGVRRLMGHVGGKDSFAEGQKDLEELGRRWNALGAPARLCHRNSQ